MIIKKISEQDLKFPVLYCLSLAGFEGLSTNQLRNKIWEVVEASGENTELLDNRNDVKLDQIIRNIVSHRNQFGNIINQSFVEYDGLKLKITEQGLKELNGYMKVNFKNRING